MDERDLFALEKLLLKVCVPVESSIGAPRKGQGENMRREACDSLLGVRKIVCVGEVEGWRFERCANKREELLFIASLRCKKLVETWPACNSLM